MVEFITNNNISTSIKLSPFFIIKDLYPYMRFDIVKVSDTSTYKQIL